MEKMEYVKPSAEVIHFDNSDVISASGICHEMNFGSPSSCNPTGYIDGDNDSGCNRWIGL